MKVFIFHLNKNIFFCRPPSNLHVNRSTLQVLSSHGIHTLANVVIVDPRVLFFLSVPKILSCYQFFLLFFVLFINNVSYQHGHKMNDIDVCRYKVV